jgi:hypothetical protein
MGARSDSSYAAGRTFTDQDGVLHAAGHTVEVISTAVNRTLTQDESGAVVIVTAADKVITLPATQLGLVYTVMLGAGGLSASTGLSVSPAAADQIIGNGFTVADDKDAINTGATDVVGDSITLVGDGSAGWYVTNVTGTWAREA